MNRSRNVAALDIGLLASLHGPAQPVKAEDLNAVTAIDIVLEPDATMVQHDRGCQRALVKEFPKGFALARRTTHTSRACSGT
jgi:hypothetical protein